jgi:hypothetical protein
VAGGVRVVGDQDGEPRQDLPVGALDELEVPAVLEQADGDEPPAARRTASRVFG